MKPEDVGWLAGIFDGEGYVGIYNKDKKLGRGAAVVLKINNTCPRMIIKICHILDDAGIGFAISEQPCR